MDNQHQKIKGYRDLSQEEIDLMNEGKDLAEKCGASKLKWSDVNSIRDMYSQGITRYRISKIFHISFDTVTQIVFNRSWNKC